MGENLEKIIKPEMGSENKTLGVDIFRHGEAKYGQGEVPLAEANDLTEKGIEKVRENAEQLAELIGSNEEVAIWSSPMGRTLQTAKIIAEVLKQKGIKLRAKGVTEESGIKVFNELTEVKNFSWKSFSPLITGGEVEFAGKKFFVDKSLTNPKNLGKTYYMENGVGNIDPRAKEQWPKEYVQEIEGFEKFFEATKRIMRPLARLKKLGDKPYRVIIVTHDALTGFIANVFSGGEENGIDPGSFINLERKNGKLVATKVGELKEGDKETDVIDEFNKRREN
jgi:broad specificity phosphatase PhoE